MKPGLPSLPHLMHVYMPEVRVLLTSSPTLDLSTTYA